MRYSKSVTMLKGLQTLLDHLRGHALSVRFTILDAFIMAVKKFTSRAELHDEVQVVLVVVGLEVLDNVGVVNLLEQVNLVHDRGEIFGGHLVLAEHLDCDLVLRVASVDTLINLTKGAFPKDMAIDIVDLLELMYTCLDFNLRCFFSLFEHNMVLVMATLDAQLLSFGTPTRASFILSRLRPWLLAVSTTHFNRLRILRLQFQTLKRSK